MPLYPHYKEISIPSLVPDLHLRLYLHHLCKVYLRCNLVLVYHQLVYTCLDDFAPILAHYTAVQVPRLVPVLYLRLPLQHLYKVHMGCSRVYVYYQQVYTYVDDFTPTLYGCSNAYTCTSLAPTPVPLHTNAFCKVYMRCNRIYEDCQ